VHHNIILRGRQSGISYNAAQTSGIQGKPEAEDFAVYNNVVYLGSCMTNSMGVSASGGVKGFELRNNRIYGRGEMPECVFVGAGASYGKVSGSYAYARSTGKVSKEYGATSGLSAALRLCWGPHHIEVFDNTFITSAGKTNDFRGSARCVWAACSDARQPEWKTSGEITIRDNEIAAMLDDADGVYTRAITVCGSHEVSAHGLAFRGNRVTTNAHCVVLSESYGCGSSDVQFIGNTFVKAGKGDTFRFLTCGYWDKPTTGSSFVDSRFEGGASIDNVTFEGSGERNFSVGWTLTVKTAPGAEVVITDAQGKESFWGKADVKGVASAPLMQYRLTPDGKTSLTPHKVKAELDGKTAQKTLMADRSQEIELPLK
jgi:hypothetical protein